MTRFDALSIAFLLLMIQFGLLAISYEVRSIRKTLERGSGE